MAPEPRPRDAPPRVVGHKSEPIRGGLAGAYAAHPGDERVVEHCAECARQAGLLRMARSELRRWAAVAASQVETRGEPHPHTLRVIARARASIGERLAILDDHPEHRKR